LIRTFIGKSDDLSDWGLSYDESKVWALDSSKDLQVFKRWDISRKEPELERVIEGELLQVCPDGNSAIVQNKDVVTVQDLKETKPLCTFSA
jgi:hypothetical protein